MANKAARAAASWREFALFDEAKARSGCWPEAGCDVKVGFHDRSHNLMSGVVREPRHAATIFDLNNT